MPQLALLLVFTFWPLTQVIGLAFTRYDVLSSPEFVGFANFEFLFAWQDFQRIILNNVLLLLGVAVWVAVPFILSILIFPMKHATLIRTLLFIPAMLPPITVGVVFRIVLANDGPINQILKTLTFGVLSPNWLTDSNLVLFSVIMVISWATMGTGILLFSAGLAAISPSYVEAALLDGANKWQIIWHIYRPGLSSVTRFFTLMLTITTLTGFFPWIYALTRGGPGVSSVTLDYAIYQTLVGGTQLGRGAAIAVIALILMAFVILIQVVMRRIRQAEDWS
ncbi:MAG: sugar ABC transporter permease [Salinibacterium sp.]|nr:sugar ABC transporter permease [Salinibacterium sp.]